MKRINFKNKYSWIILLGCILLATIAMFAADWVVGRVQLEGYPNYVYGEHQQSEFGGCICGFHTEKIYDGTNKMPTNAVGEKVWTSTNDEWFDAYTFTYRDTTISSDNNKIQSADDGDETLYNILPAGTYTVRITEPATGQVICKNHPLTISPLEYEVTYEFANKNDTNLYVGVYPQLKVSYTPAVGEVKAAFTPNTSFKDATGETVSTSVVGLFLDNYRIDSAVTYDSVNDPLLFNNYDLGKDYGVNKNTAINYTTVATATSSATGLHYISLMHAFNDKNAMNSGTITALQNVKFGNKTYYSVSNYDHIIDDDVTVPAGVTLRIPNGVTAAVGGKISVRPAGSDRPAYDFTRVDDGTKEGLFLIYQEHSNADDPSAVATHSNAYFRSDWLKNVVTVESAEITNKGTITIDAVVTGGAGGAPYNSIVLGDYSKITLDSKSKITNTGTINCYGFIDCSADDNNYANDAYNNDGNIKEENIQLFMDSGKLYTIFTIVEHRGGNVYMGMVNPNVDDLNEALNCKLGSWPEIENVYSPALTTFVFHRFYIQSVSVHTKISEDALMIGELTMYANGGPNQAQVNFIGKTSNPIIFNLSGDDSYAYFKYTHNEDATERKMDIDTYGDAEINPLSLQLTVKKSMSVAIGTAYAIMQLDMNTLGSLLPISHYFDITFNKSTSKTTVTMNQDIKILPGGKVTIGKDVEATIKSIAVYENNDLLNGLALSSIKDMEPSLNGAEDKGIAQGERYPNMPSGKLEIKGTLEVVNNIGGNITPSSNSAKLIILGKNHIISQEVLATYATQIKLKATIGISVEIPIDYNASCYSNKAKSTLYASGNLATGDESKNQLLTSSTYTAIVSDNNKYAWYNTNATITLNANGGTFLSNGQQVPTISVTVPVDSTNGCLDISNTMRVPTRTGYAFGEWYLDDDFEKPLSENQSSIKYDSELFARWKKVIMVEFDSNMEGATQISTKPVTMNYDGTPETLDAFTEKPSTLGYKFIGWYVGSEKITLDTNIREYVINDVLTVIAKWEKAQTYTVEHISGKTGITFTNGQTIISEDDPYEGMPKASAADNDHSLDYYLIGWSKTEGATEADVSIMFTQAPAEGETLKLYAVWDTKVTVRFDANNNQLNLTNPDSIYLNPNQTYSVWDFAVCNNLHNGDTLNNISVYWNNQFQAIGSGSISGDGVISVSESTDKVLTIQPVWQEKHIVYVKLPSTCGNACTWSGTITGTQSNSASFNEGTESYYAYFLPTETISINVSVTGYKNSYTIFGKEIIVAQHTVSATITNENNVDIGKISSNSSTSSSANGVSPSITNGGKTTTITIAHS